MSTNPNLQQINVFSKGMNTDTSDAYIPNDLYRYAENLRFVTDKGENSGELRLIEGYNRIDYGTGNHSPNQGTIIAVTTIRNFIITLENKQNTGYIVLYNTEKPVSEQRYEPIAIDEEWNASLCYSLVTRWEAENNIKLYVADGEHKLTSFLIDPNGDELQHIKSIERAFSTGGGYVFGGFATDEETGEFTYKKISGLLHPAIVQYAYILYSKNGGKSNISPSTPPISLYSENETHKGLMDNPYTDIGLQITINETRKDNRYNKILIYRITYSQLGQHPNIDLIIDDDLRDEPYTFADKGQDPIESGLSFAEFIAQDYMEICPQYIESKNDYLFAANFLYYKHDDIFNAYTDWDAEQNVTWSIIADTPTILDDNHSGKRSLLRGETYRYAIVLYDKYGNKWPAKFIADVEVPDYGEYGFEEPVLIDAGQIKTVSLGVSFTINDLDQDKFPYYEIVRVSRGWSDRKTLASGIIGRTMEYVPKLETINGNVYTLLYDGSNKCYPSGLITMGSVVGWETFSSRSFSPELPYDEYWYLTAFTHYSKVVLFCSPEISYGNYLKDVLDAYGDNLDIEITHTCDSLYVEDTFEQSGPTVPYVMYGSSGWKYKKETENNQNIISLSPNPIQYYGFGFSYWHPEGTAMYNCVRNTKNNVEEVYPAQNIIKLTTTGNINYLTNTLNYNALRNNIKVALSSEYNGFSKNEEFEFNNTSISIGNKVFVNWTVAQLEYDLQDSTNTTGTKNNFKIASYNSIYPSYDGQHRNVEWNYPIGCGGKCLLINLNNYELIYHSTQPTEITFARLRNKNAQVYEDKKYSAYASFGNYFKNDGKTYKVFDGDCYIQYFYYNAVTTFDSEVYNFVPKLSTVYIVPIETAIDMNSDYGDSYKRMSEIYQDKNIRYIQDKAVQQLYDYTLEHDACMYNTAYSSEPSIKISTSIDYDDLKNNKFDYRVAYSMQKSNNERYDSWLQFKSGDYIDVDTRYGEITNLRLFKDQLVFWLKNATGLLSVNERTMLQDVNDTNIILGNGDVLQRYDYLTTEYGMKEHLMCDAQSDTTLYWWDSFKKDIISYPGGRQVLPLKRQKQVSKYLTNGTEVEHPCLAHDIKYNEIIASVVDDPIVYSELIQQFTSIYKTPFDNKANILDGLILFNQGSAYNWDEKGVELLPMLKYIVNDNHTMVKVYDNTLIGMGEEFYYDNFYDAKHYKRIGEETLDDQQKNGGGIVDEIPTQPLKFEFDTTKQHSEIQKDVTNREYDLRFAVPRQCTKNEQTGKWEESAYCDRMRGRTMECTLTSSSSSTKFSIQYIITKYRISWS